MSFVQYKIAEHVFALEADCVEAITVCLPFYSAFVSDVVLPVDSLLFVMHIRRHVSACGRVLSCFEREGARYVVMQDFDGNYGFDIELIKSGLHYTMYATADFKCVQVQMLDCEEDALVLNNCVMMAYAFASAGSHTLMLHASVVTLNERGYLFLGKSATGKSTHSRLWMKYIPGVELLNDDNPIVRVVDGKPRVYGSPWSGKTPCYRQASVGVGALVGLKQASENRTEQLAAVPGFALLLSACSVMKWDERIYSGVCETLSELLTAVPVFRLHCRPDAAAAVLSYKTVHRC